MTKRLILISGLLFLFFSASVFFACKSEDADNKNETDTLLHIKNKTEKTFKFNDKLFSVPSPFVASNLIGEISEEYNGDILNPPENKINYALTFKKALNLGVYTADLAYTNIYEQFSATTKYIKVVRSLTAELQIMNSYTEEILENFENNLHDKDSLNKIFADAYRETDYYLSKNNREYISTLVVTGAWTEGLYLMTQLAKENNNKKLIDRIGEQKYSLQNLLKLLEGEQKDDNNFRELRKKLNNLNLIFNKIEIKYKYFNQIVAPNERKTIILSETEIKITPELLKEITEETKQLRKFIIK